MDVISTERQRVWKVKGYSFADNVIHLRTFGLLSRKGSEGGEGIN